MTTDRIPTPSSLPTTLIVGKSDRGSSMGDALTVAMLALVTASTIVAQNSGKTQDLNNSISDLLTDRQSQQLQDIINKYTDYFHQIEQQKSSTNWLHYIGIGYIMDAIHWISEKFDALIGSALRAIGVPEDKIKFITGLIKTALVVSLLVVVGIASGGSLAAVGLTAGAALMLADPSSDLVVGGVEAFGGDKNIATIAAACVSAVLMIATMAVGGATTAVKGAQLAQKLPGIIEKLGATFAKLAEIMPRVTNVAGKIAGGAMTAGSAATGASQVAAGSYGMEAGKTLQELAPLQEFLQKLLGTIQVNNQYVKTTHAVEKETQRAMQTDGHNLLRAGQTMIQTSKQHTKI